jgi:hypothetical protein
MKDQKYKITVKKPDGNEAVYENVTAYRHTADGLEMKKEDDSTEVVPKADIKHCYVGSKCNENMIRSLNS